MRRGRAPCVKGILAAEDDTHHSRPLESPGRAAATLERARRATEELGKGVPFLIVYYGSDGPGGWQPLDRPLRTVTTLDRFGLVAWQGRTPMLRMLQVDELMAAMGFRGEYNLDGIGQRRAHPAPRQRCLPPRDDDDRQGAHVGRVAGFSTQWGNNLSVH